MADYGVTQEPNTSGNYLPPRTRYTNVLLMCLQVSTLSFVLRPYVNETFIPLISSLRIVSYPLDVGFFA